MLPSPIQLKEMIYLGIKVWAQPIENVEEGKEAPAVDFDFNGVRIGERIESQAFAETENAEPTLYGVKLRIAIENKEGKIAPYTIDVEVAGYFEVNKNVPLEKREDLVIVNGTAVLYSAIREQVMTITARSSQGKFILPTVNFQDRLNTEAGKPKSAD